MISVTSKTVFALLLVAGQLSHGAAGAVFSESFVCNAQPTASVCTNWDNFRAALTGDFDRVECGGSLVSTVVLSGAVGAAALARALNTATAVSPHTTVTVAGQQMTVGPCDGVEINFASAGCGCGAWQNMRPCKSAAYGASYSYNWGGLAGTNCNAPDQTMTLAFYRAGGGAGGDPHFKTWHGAQYDFHGHCDLVLLNAPHVADGHGNANKGLSIHIRSSPYKTFFSFVSDVAIRIGEDILEVGNQGKHYINGVLQTVGATEDLAGYKVTSSKSTKKPRHVCKTRLAGCKEETDTREFKDWITVSVLHATQSNFGASVGLMGRFEDGAMVGRDNVAIHTDNNECGQDWQVQGSTDGFLFRVPSPYPKHCQLPSLTNKKIRLRRLEESIISKEEAMQACSHWGSDIMDCVLDVRASGDLEVALNGPIASPEDMVVSFTNTISNSSSPS